MTQISLLSTWRWAVQSCLDRNPHPFSIRSSQGRIGSNRACSQGETPLLSLVINIDKHTMVGCSNKAFRSLKKHRYYQEKWFGAFFSLTQALNQGTPCSVTPFCLPALSVRRGTTTISVSCCCFRILSPCLHFGGRGTWVGELEITTTCSCVRLTKNTSLNGAIGTYILFPHVISGFAG